MIKTIKIIDNEQDNYLLVNKKDLEVLKIKGDRIIHAKKHMDVFVAEIRNGLSSELKDKALYVSGAYEPQIVKDSFGCTCVIFQKKDFTI